MRNKFATAKEKLFRTEELLEKKVYLIIN